jgi:hypothetical protein
MKTIEQIKSEFPHINDEALVMEYIKHQNNVEYLSHILKGTRARMVDLMLGCEAEREP